MAAVELDKAQWREMYPDLADLSDVRLDGLWAVACQIVGNGPRARVPYDPERGVLTRKWILYALTCHLAALAQRGDMVGNVTNAAQGSVNAGLALMQQGNSRWYEQTQCGLTAWQLLAPYRSGGLYVPGRC